jgi:hypothetical protein
MDVCAQPAIDALLQRTTFSTFKDEASAWAYLELLDEKSWSEASKDVGITAKIPIDGVPFGGNATYNQFDAFRTAKHHEYKAGGKASTSLVVLSSTLPVKQADDFLDLAALCLGVPVLRVTQTNITADSAQVTIKWRDPQEGKSKKHPVTLSTTVKGGSVAGAPAGHLLTAKQSSFINGAAQTVTILREGKSDITGTVTVEKPPFGTLNPSQPFANSAVQTVPAVLSGRVDGKVCGPGKLRECSVQPENAGFKVVWIENPATYVITFDKPFANTPQVDIAFLGPEANTVIWKYIGNDGRGGGFRIDVRLNDRKNDALTPVEFFLAVRGDVKQ